MYLAKYTAAIVSSSKPTPPRLELRSLWTPPPAPMFKINVDGAVLSALGAMGIGIIIRDEEGQVEAALSKRIEAPLGAIEAEAKAFEVGLLVAKDIGIQEVVLEGDSIIIYNALYDVSNPPSSVEPIIKGMHALCKYFRRVEFSHGRRQGNSPAHLLAKHAKSIADFSTWIEENRCFIEQALIQDVIAFSHT